MFEYCPHDMGKLVDSLSKPFHESEVKCLMQQVGRLCCTAWLLRLGEGTVEFLPLSTGPCGGMPSAPCSRWTFFPAMHLS